MNEKTYYHFLSSDYAIDGLAKRRIRISALDSLNDPFELMPYRRYKFKERQPYNKTFREISKNWGILCFSQSWDKQLLWAHYADRHRGIALGFEILTDKILEVEYSGNTKRTKFNLTDDQQENARRFLGLAKVKYQEWGYEKEYRILVKLTECDSEKNRETGKTNYFLKFTDRLRLKEIILGCRFDHKKERLNISRLANDWDVDIVATRPGWEDYKIHKDGSKTDLYKKK